MITAKDNKLIKHIKSLFQKKYREEFGEYIVEGLKMVKEAIEYAKIKELVICRELLDNEIQAKLSEEDYIKYMQKDFKIKEIKVTFVSKAVFCDICDTKTPQGILCVVAIPKKKKVLEEDVIFALDEIQDPGNLGTIIRTIDSAGFKNLIVSNNCADIYNSKVVRSTMGGIYRLAINRLDMELKDYLLSLKDEGYSIVCTDLKTDKYYYDLNFSDKMIIVIGNESKGVSKEVLEIADDRIKIPMLGKTESLNASVALSIIAYEKVRRIVKG